MKLGGYARLCASASVLAFGLLYTGGALAQEGSTATSSAGTIIVTGQNDRLLTTEATTGSRLGLTPLETPASINIIDGDALRARGDLTVMDGVTRAPGVTNAGNPGNGGTALAMRGFDGQGSVLQLFDGLRLFPVASTVTFPSDPWNIQRIEILSGPASVLYGQGALGGAVNVVPWQPNRDRLQAQGEAGYGSQNSWHLAAGAGGPLGGAFSFRADASYRQSDGFVDRGESDNLALSGALRFEPSDSFSLTLRDDYGDFHPSRYFGTPLIDSRLDSSIRERNYNVSDAAMHWRDNRLALTLDWKPTDTLAILNTAYRMTSNRLWRNLETYCWIGADGDCPNGIGYGTPGNIYRADNYGIVHDQEQIGNQGNIKLSTPLGSYSHNDLLVGLDVSRVTLVYSHDFGSDYQEEEVNPRSFNPGLFLDTQGIAPRYHTRTNTIALYMEDRLKIGEGFSLVGGLRYEHNKVGRWTYLYNAAGTQIVGETPALNDGNDAYKTLDHTTWRVGIVYQPAPSFSLYGQVATAVDPLGTLTTYSGSSSQFVLTNANGYQVEVGVKAQFLDGRGSATLAGYQIVKRNLFSQATTNSAIEQVGQRSSQGVEASLSLELPAGFGLDANGTLLDANFDEFTGYIGRTPAGVPEVAANVELRWSSMARFQARANLRYVGRRFSDNDNRFRIPAYAVVDLSATYALTPNIGVDLRVYNLFDKDYAASFYSDQQWILGRPRSFDISVRAGF
jgi:iron complex outermembrane receptor protein